MILKLAPAWLVPVLVCGCSRSVEVHWDPERKPLLPIYVGSMELPVAGVEGRNGQPVVYVNDYRADATGDVPEGVQLLGRRDVLVLSKGSSTAGIATYASTGRTEFRWVDDPGAVLAFDERRTFVVSEDGTTLVSVFRLPDSGEDHRVEIFERGGGAPAVRIVPGVFLVRVSRDGELIAVLTREELVFLGKDGTVLRSDPPAIDLRFSPSGHWSARFGEDDVRLHDRGGRMTTFGTTDGPPLDAAFDARDELFCFVDRGSFHLVDLTGSSPRGIHTEPADGESQYRSVSFGPEGFIGLGRIEILELPRRDPLSGPDHFVPGKSEIYVDLLDITELLSNLVLRAKTYSTLTSEWNKKSPVLYFIHVVFAGTWQAVYQVDFP